MDFTENVPSDSKLISGTFCEVSLALLKCGRSITLHLFHHADTWRSIAKRSILFAFLINTNIVIYGSLLSRVSCHSETTL